jgi:TatA/E family protein of Tat protein translocase
MNFLGLGPGELVLIAILGLIVFGPGKLPEIANQFGRAVRDFRRSTSDISSEFQRSFSLDETPSKDSKAPAARATNGAGTAGVSEPQPRDATSEPPLVDTREWHWEESIPSQPVSASAEARPHGNGAFWQWDESPEAEGAAAVGEAASQKMSPTSSAAGPLWQWNETEELPSASKPRRASKSRRRTKDE